MKGKLRGPTRKLRSDSYGMLNEVLRDARVDRKLTLRKLSEKTGIPFNTLGQYETLRVYPGIENQVNIATVLGINHEELFPVKLRKVANLIRKYRNSNLGMNRENEFEVSCDDALNHCVPLSRTIRRAYGHDPKRHESDVRWRHDYLENLEKKKLDLLRKVEDALKRLSVRESVTLKHRYCLEDVGEVLSCREIGEMFGVSHTAIQNDEKNAIGVLKDVLGGDYGK